MNIVVLTGAGVSADSGIRTFRDSNGLWENHSIEEVATPEGFARNPNLVQSFYNARRRQLLEGGVAPNAAHLALADFEKKWIASKRGDFLLVTQNVDNLHARAGSKKLLHMHGELQKARCLRTHQVFDWTTDIVKDSECECCRVKGTLRPHIVWFGEMPFEMDFIYEKLERCDLFLAIGTSGQVYPAAGFVDAVSLNKRAARTVEINQDMSANFSRFSEVIRGGASAEAPRFLEKILSENGL